MTFYEAFAQNMEQLGVPAPKRLFDSVTTATATVVAINRAIVTYGPKVTLKEIVLTMPALFTASALVELGTLTAEITAAFYVGCCIGSLLVATGHSLTHLGMLRQAHQMHLSAAKGSGAWLQPAFAKVTFQSSRRLA